MALLHYACEFNYKDIVKTLLNNPQININIIEPNILCFIQN